MKLREPKTVYAICTSSRSGSSWLCQMIKSVQKIGWPGEYLNNKPHWKQEFGLDADLPDREYLAEVAHRRSGSCRIFGIKMVPQWLAELESWRTPEKWICLERRDTWRQAISLYRADRTGQWHMNEPQPMQACPFDGEAIGRCRDQIWMVRRAWESLFCRRRLSPLRVTYEELLENPQGEVERIARYVGCTCRVRPVESTLRVMRDETTEQWLKRIQQPRS